MFIKSNNNYTPIAILAKRMKTVEILGDHFFLFTGSYLFYPFVPLLKWLLNVLNLTS